MIPMMGNTFTYPRYHEIMNSQVEKYDAPDFTSMPVNPNTLLYHYFYSSEVIQQKIYNLHTTILSKLHDVDENTYAMIKQLLENDASEINKYVRYHAIETINAKITQNLPKKDTRKIPEPKQDVRTAFKLAAKDKAAADEKVAAMARAAEKDAARARAAARDEAAMARAAAKAAEEKAAAVRLDAEVEDTEKREEEARNAADEKAIADKEEAMNKKKAITTKIKENMKIGYSTLWSKMNEFVEKMGSQANAASLQRLASIATRDPMESEYLNHLNEFKRFMTTIYDGSDKNEELTTLKNQYNADIDTFIKDFQSLREERQVLREAFPSGGTRKKRNTIRYGGGLTLDMPYKKEVNHPFLKSIIHYVENMSTLKSKNVAMENRQDTRNLMLEILESLQQQEQPHFIKDMEYDLVQLDLLHKRKMVYMAKCMNEMLNMDIKYIIGIFAKLFIDHSTLTEMMMCYVAVYNTNIPERNFEMLYRIIKYHKVSYTKVDRPTREYIYLSNLAQDYIRFKSDVSKYTKDTVMNVTAKYDDFVEKRFIHYYKPHRTYDVPVLPMYWYKYNEPMLRYFGEISLSDDLPETYEDDSTPPSSNEEDISETTERERQQKEEEEQLYIEETYNEVLSRTRPSFAETQIVEATPAPAPRPPVPVARPVARPAARPVTRPAARPVTRPAPGPAPRPAARPVVRQAPGQVQAARPIALSPTREESRPATAFSGGKRSRKSTKTRRKRTRKH